MPADRLIKHMLIPKIIPEGRQRGCVIERHGSETAILGKVKGHMAGHRGAGAVPRKEEPAVVLVQLTRAVDEQLKSAIGPDFGAHPVRDFDALQQFAQAAPVLIEERHGVVFPPFSLKAADPSARDRAG